MVDIAAEVMREHGCGCVPVIDADGKLAGIVTDRDICMAALRAGLPLAAIPVMEAMTATVHTCSIDDEISVAERTMCREKVRRLPVLDAEERPIGLLSIDDLARAADRLTIPFGPQSLAEGVGHTLASITKPPHVVDAPSEG
jgi:CBS domain-containing protein